MKKFEYLTEDQIERFWSKVKKTAGFGPNGDCWQWTGGRKNKEGYGGYYLKQIDNTVNCHKIAFMIAHNFGIGEIPGREIVIRHTCNNYRCVNPQHLLLGTFKDNSQDMVRAGNSLRGPKNPKALFTYDQAKEIRNLWDTGNMSKSDLARLYDVDPGTIARIVLNTGYRDDNYQVKFFDHRKFSDDIIQEIRDRFQKGESQSSLSRKFDMSMSQIGNIVHNRQRRK